MHRVHRGAVGTPRHTLHPAHCHSLLFPVSYSLRHLLSFLFFHLKSATRKGLLGTSPDERCRRKVRVNENVPLYQQKTWNITWSLKKSRTPTSDATSPSSRARTTSRTRSWSCATPRTWSLSTRRCRTFTVQRRRTRSKVEWGTLHLCCCCYLPREQDPGRSLPGSLWSPTTRIATSRERGGRRPGLHHARAPPAAKTMLLSVYTSEFIRKALCSVAWLVHLSRGDSS